MNSRKQGNIPENSPLEPQGNSLTRQDKTKPDKTEGPQNELAIIQFKRYVAEHWEEVKELLSMFHYAELVEPGTNQVEQLSQHVIQGELLAYLLTNGDEALESVKEKDDGSWLKYLRRWLQRSLKQVRAGGRHPSAFKDPMTSKQENEMRRKKGEIVQ